MKKLTLLLLFCKAIYWPLKCMLDEAHQKCQKRYLLEGSQNLCYLSADLRWKDRLITYMQTQSHWWKDLILALSTLAIGLAQSSYLSNLKLTGKNKDGTSCFSILSGTIPEMHRNYYVINDLFYFFPFLFLFFSFFAMAIVHLDVDPSSGRPMYP